MSKKMPFDVDGWLSSATVQAMSLVQRAAYFQLLCWCWQNGGWLPDDDTKLARMSGLDYGWETNGEAVRNCFTNHPTREGLTHTKLLGLLPKSKEKQTRLPDAGPVGPVFLKYPVVGNTSWTLTEDQVATWERLYVGVDVKGECRKALAWLDASRKRQKTGGGMKKFLTSWLNRANDSKRVNVKAGISITPLE